MDRRKFILSTVAGLAKATDLYPKLCGAGITEFPPIGLVGSKDASEELFPFRTLGAMEWSQFNAAGFSSPVCGVIHRKSFQAECGVPLGTIDTGCIDLDTDGTFGYCSMFGSFVPPRGPLSQPFLGLSLGKE